MTTQLSLGKTSSCWFASVSLLKISTLPEGSKVLGRVEEKNWGTQRQKGKKSGPVDAYLVDISPGSVKNRYLGTLDSKRASACYRRMRRISTGATGKGKKYHAVAVSDAYLTRSVGHSEPTPW